MGQSAHQLASGCPGRQAETSQVQHFFGPGVATLEASFFHWRVAENLEACYRARVWEAFTNSQTWKHASFSYSFFVMFNTSPCVEWLSFLVFLTSFKQLLTHLWHPWHYKSELCLKHHIESLLLYWSSSYRYVKSSLFSFNHWKHNFYKSEKCLRAFHWCKCLQPVLPRCQLTINIQYCICHLQSEDVNSKSDMI